MTDEDSEFNRIERESIARKLAVQYALQKLHDENQRLGLYNDAYKEIKDEILPPPSNPRPLNSI